MHSAAESGNVFLMEQLLQQGHSLVQRVDGKTPLHVAAIQGHTDVVTFLARMGAQISSAGFLLFVFPMY